ncbi:integral membrane protein [Talaromyces stipitatus ATCC 10500]|uniref:Integral membrane protein n=1 Tax=Talaromyces stipitatus (strain ATCC 10500 / CBS 375.48 / QM 6759 / NRRL 1006) TaxID=441959 RepID=B8MI27_TALSN|nr:uncharacterized protein TSTA_022430 [Talaromyces stipitatus ATCC 10500]EED17189.1 integral membrane protein [Talaromyces stipitatus ATCC 10500]
MMGRVSEFYAVSALALAFSGVAFAQYQTFTPPGQNGISYTVNIPQRTATSGSGPIFIQMKSTVGLQWFALGQGTQMQGSHIFVVYGSGNNVTVSPRLGGPHVEPLYYSQARFSVLNGSGISNGVITANIRCDSCITWPGGQADVTSSSSPWIWAVKSGDLLQSESVSATIQQHDIAGLATLNLKQATGSDSENPFLTLLNPSNSSSSTAVTTSGSQSVDRKRTAHAVIMIIAMVVLFPSFAIALHLVSSSWIVVLHAWSQVLTLALTTAGAGIGISLATTLQLTTSYHSIIGIIVVSSLILFQPAMGLLQHRYFRSTGKKSIFAYLHRWFGRSMLTLGIINAGLGFRVTGIGSSIAPVGAVIAYGVVAGIVWLVVSSPGYKMLRDHRSGRPVAFVQKLFSTPSITLEEILPSKVDIKMYIPSIAAATIAALSLASPVLSNQSFVNTGTLSGWSTQNIEHNGSIEQVTNVVYNGTSALKFTQVYDSNYHQRYHSEKIETQVYKLGDQGFYGFAFRLQENWQASPAQSYNIAQFIADFTDTGCDDWMPSSMVWVIGDQLATRVKYGSICNQQIQEWKGLKTVTPGEWHTIVIQANWQSDSTGFYKMWYDGEKVVNELNLATMIDDARPFDFHIGIYANGWHDQKKNLGTQNTREIWIDSVGIGSTFADADPTKIEG